MLKESGNRAGTEGNENIVTLQINKTDVTLREIGRLELWTGVKKGACTCLEKTRRGLCTGTNNDE